MMQATHGLSATIGLCKSVSRRAFMRFGAVAATCGLVPAAVTGAPKTDLTQPLGVGPTPRGRDLLRAIKARRDHVNSFVLAGEDIPDDAYDEHGVEEALAAIKAMPVRTMGDVVDRLIVIGERCEPHSMIEHEEVAPHFNVLLGALAGLKLDDCTLCSSDPDSPI